MKFPRRQLLRRGVLGSAASLAFPALIRSAAAPRVITRLTKAIHAWQQRTGDSLPVG